MTEAGEKWILDKTGESSTFDISEAEFWIRAFCDEVEKRAKALAEGDPIDQFWKGHAVEQLKAELLGP